MNYDEARIEVDRFNAHQREGGRAPSHLAVICTDYRIKKDPFDVEEVAVVCVVSAAGFTMVVFDRGTAKELREAMKCGAEVVP